jgi:acetoin utilization deacetylase AcuC-like enzyme
MITIHSDDHRHQHGKGELTDGRLMPVVEKPERVEIVLQRVRAERLGDVVAPDSFGPGPRAAVHDPGYLAFLEGAWAEWETEHGDTHDGLPLIWPVRNLRPVCPQHIDGKLSYYALDAGTPITRGTWRAVTASADVAVTGAKAVLDGAPAAFSLCRPPGHHATADQLGGYCFLNNAAIATQWLRDQGIGKLAVLDVDYHHGNGTQAIFDARTDVAFASVHADPVQEFPYFLGHADETGTGPGAGATANYPLPWGTDWAAYAEALDAACRWVAGQAPELLVVSLGVDTYKHDPISKFRLETTDFPKIGRRLQRLGLPTLFVMEGGYAIEEIGVNAVGVLTGFEGA